MCRPRVTALPPPAAISRAGAQWGARRRLQTPEVRPTGCLMREVIKSNQMSSNAIRGNQVQSELNRRNQSSSAAISTGRLLHATVEAAFVALGLDNAIGHVTRAWQEETWPKKRCALAKLGRRSSQALSGAIRGHQGSSEEISFPHRLGRARRRTPPPSRAARGTRPGTRPQRPVGTRGGRRGEHVHAAGRRGEHVHAGGSTVEGSASW